ncbi:MAG: hypothetical protein KDA25_08770, partial [Phycisphaerales bacterium]|nr:hypothetical protein [Phycisphaerales bacterium]
ATWYDELDAVLAKQDQGESVPLPDEGVFKAGPAAAGPRIAAAQAERTTERDGWLWFRPVDDGDGSTFVDLVGNVAEFVRSGDRQRVIGASALSPRSTEATEPLGTHDDLAYCDVGFRLAFSADERALLPPSRCDRLVALLEATRFIGEQ